MTNKTIEELQAQLQQREAEQKELTELLKRSQEEPIFPLTEQGNAEHFSLLFKDTYKFVFETESWFRWNGFLWEEDRAKNVIIDFKTISRAIHNYGSLLFRIGELHTDEDKKKEYQNKAKRFFAWANRSQSQVVIKNSLALAQAEGMHIPLTTFDSKGFYVGLQNGVLKIKKDDFQFIQHKPEYMLTKKLAVQYDPTATCPNFLSIVDKMTGGDPDYVSFLQRVAGQALLGNPGKEKLFIFWGTGANLKSTFVCTLQEILNDYSLTMDPDVLMEGGKSNAEYYLAVLRGVRLLELNETKKGSRLAENIIKKLMDSGDCMARFPSGRPFSFQPVCTPILTTNHKPKIGGNDYGIWRRLLVVPFTYQMPESEKIENYRETFLQPEWSGILNWIIEGCMMYQTEGLNPPEVVKHATKMYRTEQDKIGCFLSETCHTKTDGKIALKTLYIQYVKWCEENGYHAGAIKTLASDLRDRNITVRVGTNNLAWIHGYEMGAERNMTLIPGGKE